MTELTERTSPEALQIVHKAFVPLDLKSITLSYDNFKSKLNGFIEMYFLSLQKGRGTLIY